jgi:hypothetical protein
MFLFKKKWKPARWEGSSHFLIESDGNFDGIVCRPFKEKDDKMGGEGGCGMMDDLIMKESK